MANDVQDRVRALLDSLAMRDGLSALDAALDEEPAKRVAALAAMERVLQAEANARSERRIQRRLDDSHLPDRPTLEAFDFDFQPGLDRELVVELATLAWVDRREDLVLVGQTGLPTYCSTFPPYRLQREFWLPSRGQRSADGPLHGPDGGVDGLDLQGVPLDDPWGAGDDLPPR